MKKLYRIVGALPFFAAVFLNAFVDLGHKIVIQNTVFKLYDGQEQVILTAIVNGLILLPFIFLLSPAGFLSDRFAKTKVMQATAWGAVMLTLFITLCYYMGWFWPAFAMTFLLAAQSAIYSPAKLGYIKELFGKNRLGEANGAVSSLSIVAILAGIFVFSILFETWYPGEGKTDADILRAIAPIGWLLVLNSVIELIMVYRLPTGAVPQNHTIFSWQDFLSGRLAKQNLSVLAKRKVIRLCIIGLATFWSVGQVMLAAFPAFIKAELAMDNTIIVQGILACSGIGIALGAVFAGKLSRNYIETGLLPVGAIGIAVGLWLLPQLSSTWGFALDFVFIGFMGGCFIVPLNALIQFNARDNELGTTLAANNWVQNMAMLSFLLLTVAFALLGLSSKSLLQLIAVVAIVGGCYTIYQLPQSLTRFLLSYLLSRHYRVVVQGVNHIPAQGGALLLGNHVSWIDWAIIQIACPRPVRFVMIRNIYERWYLKWFFDLFGCIPIEQGVKSREALAKVSELLKAGELVCLFPEGTLSRTGHLAEFRRGYERACAKIDNSIPILPFYLRGLWGSQFSRSSDKLKHQSKSILGRELMVAFGKPLSKDTPADVLKRRILDLSIQSWHHYVENLPTIPHTWMGTSKALGKSTSIIDTLGTELSGHQALVGALTISRRIRKLSPESNVGILLPTSAAGVLTNMATLLCGKTLANLNYSAGEKALLAAVSQADIQTLYTSKRFIKKLANRGVHLDTLLNQVQVIYLEDVREQISWMEKLAVMAVVKILPASMLKIIFCPRVSTQSTAAILFSSGSEGAPKGICLSHQNITANVKQIADVLNMQEGDTVMANLPLFHAFGLTVTQFMPLLEGMPMVCHADPTDSLGSAQAIAKYRATILFGTSTFLRLYIRNPKIHPLMLSSLRIVVAGAEKLQEDVRTQFALRFNKPIYEGYGATETTPVASVNLPDVIETRHWRVQKGEKLKSVGMPLPGSSCKIVDPETLEELPTGEAGMILIGGAQVMQGYLGQVEKTAAVIKTMEDVRWYVTGDKGYIDEDGFLFIIDRYSRFAKMGGEMVSLGSVEEAIKEVLDHGEIDLVAVNLPDEKKGEVVAVLSTQPLEGAVSKTALLERGLNALAFPAYWLQVDEIPKLGSGKVDFARSKQLAQIQASKI